MFWSFSLFLISLSYLIISSKNLWESILAIMKIKRIWNNEIQAVRIEDLQHRNGNIVLKLTISIIGVAACIYGFSFFMNYFQTMLWGFFWFSLLFSNIITLLSCYTDRKYGECAYLTQEFIVTVNKVLNKERCKFSLLNDVDHNTQYMININYGKRDTLYQFRAKYDIELMQNILSYYRKKD